MRVDTLDVCRETATGCEDAVGFSFQWHPTATTHPGCWIHGSGRPPSCGMGAGWISSAGTAAGFATTTQLGDARWDPVTCFMPVNGPCGGVTSAAPSAAGGGPTVPAAAPCYPQGPCGSGYMDRTGAGNPIQWACGSSCQGGPYTDAECHCACIPTAPCTASPSAHPTARTITLTLPLSAWFDRPVPYIY
eukprot:gene10098-biopygen1734